MRGVRVPPQVAAHGMATPPPSGPTADGVNWVVVSYVASISAQVSFAGYAVWYTRKLRPAAGSTGALPGEASVLRDAEGFVTARGTQGRWRLAWSFFAGGCGYVLT